MSQPRPQVARFEGRIGRVLAESEAVVRRAAAPRRGCPERRRSSCSTTPASPSSVATGPTSTRRNIDALAAGGLQFTNFHVTPLCSPTTGVAADRPVAARGRHARRCRTSAPAFRTSSVTSRTTRRPSAEVLRDRGLHDAVRRQVAPRTDGAVLGGRAVRAMAAGPWVRPLLRVPRGRDRPVPPRSGVRQPPDRSAGRSRRRVPPQSRISSTSCCG